MVYHKGDNKSVFHSKDTLSILDSLSLENKYYLCKPGFELATFLYS